MFYSSAHVILEHQVTVTRLALDNIQNILILTQSKWMSTSDAVRLLVTVTGGGYGVSAEQEMSKRGFSF